MKIGIDARLWNETGVGRYIRALVRELAALDTQHEFTLFFRKHEYETFSLPNARWRKILADISWHSIAEQIKMPQLYQAAQLDLVHIPYFSVPVGINVPFVVTIHDLTISHYATGKATTRALPIYWLKRLGYKIVLNNAIKKAQKVMTVSETVKKQIVAEHKVSAGQIRVTYEAGNLESTEPEILPKIPRQYILYVGNAHPHKNLEKLLEAFQILSVKLPQISLVFIGAADYFYNRLVKFTRQIGFADKVIFTGAVSNGDLVTWYKKASVFVFPSQSEGFGIPGLEAMSQDCPVAAADISIFHEIYGEAAFYFDQQNPEHIATALIQVLIDPPLRKRLIHEGNYKYKEYSWKKMAQETLSVYEDCAHL